MVAVALLGSALVTLAAPRGRADEGRPTPGQAARPEDRSVFRDHEGRVFTRLEDGHWSLAFSGSKAFRFVETRKTAEYIEIRAGDGPERYRLYGDKSLWSPFGDHWHPLPGSEGSWSRNDTSAEAGGGSPANREAAAALGLGRESRALPLWTQAGREPATDLAERGRALRQAVMVVGEPGAGHGTAFVISRRHRLLATNAHVADLFHRKGRMSAMRNDSGETYQVERIWYHPGVLREPADMLLVRSVSLADGPIFPFSPDVAVLGLAAGGPDLPAELELAGWDEVEDLFGLPVGMIGFPGHDTKGFPAAGQRAAATFHTGVVSRLTNFGFAAGGPAEDLQMVQHTAQSYRGFSGSPIFLRNGRVALLNNSGRLARHDADPEGHYTALAYGVRVDCLWELLLHHGLDGQVPIAADRDAVRRRLRRYAGPDPGLAALRLAEGKVGEARRLRWEFRYQEGIARCDEALKLVPGYAPAHFQRYVLRGAFLNNSGSRLSPEDSRREHALALDDCKAYVRSAPSDPNGVSSMAFMYGSVDRLTNAGKPAAQRDHRLAREGKTILDVLLTTRHLEVHQRAIAIGTRAHLRWALGDRDGTFEDIAAAMRLWPDDSTGYLNRARYYDAIGRSDLATQDRVRAEELRRRVLGR